jgi:hypothetical protein
MTLIQQEHVPVFCNDIDTVGTGTVFNNDIDITRIYTSIS